MELWFLLSLVLSFLAAAFFHNLITTSIKNRKLPPGPPSIPFFNTLQWLGKPQSELEPTLRRLRAKYGPIVTLRVGDLTQIFIFDHTLAHKALVQNGPIFSDRPYPAEHIKILNSGQHSINSAGYGPLWRFLRRNLTSEIFHSSRLKTFTHGRDWALQILIGRLAEHAESGEPVCIVEIFEHAMFCLLIFMCFGEKLDERSVKEIQRVQNSVLLFMNKLSVLNSFPVIGKIVFRQRWKELLQVRSEHERLLIPLIRASKDRKASSTSTEHSGIHFMNYVDSLLALEIPEDGGRKLTEEEMVSVCSEFLGAGTDTTTTTMQWILANLVNSQHVQEKLVEEIERSGKDLTDLEELSGMPYLKAVIMETLRRHPPGHFVLPHTVTEDVALEGYVIPKGTVINFAVAEMGLDEKVWKEPMAFRPERFLDDEGGTKVDVTGTREIKMMPFGAGRRICPGLNVGIVHLQYFLANLVREFEWRSVDGEEVDMTEKLEFTVVMKKPLMAKIVKRRRSLST